MCTISCYESSTSRRSEAAWPSGVRGFSLVSRGLRVMKPRQLGERTWERRLKDETWNLLLGSPVQHRAFEVRLIEKPHMGNHWVESGISEQV